MLTGLILGVLCFINFHEGTVSHKFFEKTSLVIIVGVMPLKVIFGKILYHFFDYVTIFLKVS